MPKTKYESHTKAFEAGLNCARIHVAALANTLNAEALAIDFRSPKRTVEDRHLIITTLREAVCAIPTGLLTVKDEC